MLKEVVTMLSHWTKTKASNTEPAGRSQRRTCRTERCASRLPNRRDKQRAQDALRALIKATRNIKPDSNNGGAAAIRALRDAS